jgi:hypothetical protein
MLNLYVKAAKAVSRLADKIHDVAHNRILDALDANTTRYGQQKIAAQKWREFAQKLDDNAFSDLEAANKQAFAALDDLNRL